MTPTIQTQQSQLSFVITTTVRTKEHHDSSDARIEGTETRLDQATVLIISDDPEFSRAVMDRWQGERNEPAFTLMSADVCRDLDSDGFDLAIVGRMRSALLFRSASML